jgi:hypothetical protein
VMNESATYMKFTQVGADLFAWCRKLTRRGRPHEAASLVPNALSAFFAFEEADRAALIGIKELVGEFERGGAHWTVKKPISRLGSLLRVDHDGSSLPVPALNQTVYFRRAPRWGRSTRLKLRAAPANHFKIALSHSTAAVVGRY